MKTIYGAAFGISTFFALNCGSGDGYGGGSPAASTQSPAQSSASAEQVVVE